LRADRRRLKGRSNGGTSDHILSSPVKPGERIFKAMDTDKDGTVDLQEMQQFMRGARGSVSRP